MIFKLYLKYKRFPITKIQNKNLIVVGEMTQQFQEWPKILKKKKKQKLVLGWAKLHKIILRFASRKKK